MLPRRVWNESEAKPEGSAGALTLSGPALRSNRQIGNQPRLGARLGQQDRRIDGAERVQARERVMRSIERDNQDRDQMHQRGDHRGAERGEQDFDQKPLDVHRQLSLSMRGIVVLSIAPAVALTGES
jgi:hypothetical protein